MFLRWVNFILLMCFVLPAGTVASDLRDFDFPSSCGRCGSGKGER